MYKIYVDNELFCDSSINELAIINPVVTLEANTAGQFTFTIPSTHPYYDNIQRLTSVIEVYRENKLIFRGFCSGDEKDLWNNRSITCEGDLSYLNDSVLRPYKWQGETVLSLLTAYIDGYGNFKGHNDQVEARKQFTMGVVTVPDPNDYIYCFTNMNNTLTEIKEDLIDDLGGYLRVRRQNGINYIDYIREEDFTIAPQIIELGVNLINYKSNIDDIDLATRVIPLGAMKESQDIEGLDTRITIESVNGGVDYLESQTAVNNFGIITKIVTFDDVHTPAKLKTKGQIWLNENQFENLVIEISAVDLGLIDRNVNTWELLQQIRVKSPVHGLDAYYPLTKMVLNLANPERDTFTLGTKTKLNSLTAKTVEASETSKKIIDEVNPTTWLNQAKQNALNMLLSETQGGYIVFEYHTNSLGQQDYVIAINVCDATTIDSALKRWRWSQNGLGYMERDNLQIPWDDSRVRLRTALTSDGKITADAILTGTLRSRTIANGGTSISNAPFKVDTNGNLTATSASISGSITASTITGSTITGDTISGGTISGTSISGTSISGGSISGASISGGQINIPSVSDSKFSVDSTGRCEASRINITDGNIKLARDSQLFSQHSVQVQGRLPNTFVETEATLSDAYFYLDWGSSRSRIQQSGASFQGTLSCTGTKNRVVQTQNYDTVLLNAYETPKPIFADEGHGKLDENGVCYIYMDDVFLETIDHTHRYRIFLTKYGQGDIWVDEVEKTWFVVRGTPNLEFDWKIDCIQRDYNYANLEKFDDTENKETDYITLTNQYINSNSESNYNKLADQYLTQYEREVLTDESNY